jgi:thymidylate synthase (FAD)
MDGMTTKESTMAEITYRSDMRVLLADHMGDDITVCTTARVEDPGVLATRFTTLRLEDRDKGLLRMLMRDRHGTPWEAVVFRFYIEAPIFVAREALRHRIASVNETSARYRELEPVFYAPEPGRNLVQTGKPGAYRFEGGTTGQRLLVDDMVRTQSASAYQAYQMMLTSGVAREVARTVLPVNIYTSWYVTINLRSLLNFLSLRRSLPNSAAPTFPQREIEMVAEQMEALAERVVPESLRLFNEYGRVAP